MQFNNAAYEILKETGKPNHQNKIADNAPSKGVASSSTQSRANNKKSMAF